MSSSISNTNNNITSPAVFITKPYDSKSRSFQAVKLAAQGSLDELRKYFPIEKDQVDTLVRVTQNEQYFTPLHYAINNKQWRVAAYLLNQGCDWTIKSYKTSSSGKNPIELLSTIPGSLNSILEELLQLNEPINLEAAFRLCSSSDLAVARRREVLANANLCINLSQKLPKDWRLLLMASLMIGSFKWKGIQNDFPKLQQIKYLPFDATLNCYQMILYASMLSGEISFKAILDHIAKGMDLYYLSHAVHQKIIDPLTPPAERHALMLPTVKTQAKNLGMKREEKYLLDINKLEIEKIQVFYIEEIDGFIEHYGLLYKGIDSCIAIHLDEHVQTVTIEPAEKVFSNKDYKDKKVYISMIPWHE